MDMEIDNQPEIFDIANQLIVIPKAVLDIFLKLENPSDLMSLYVFYYYTAKWQRTNQPKCTTNYAATGLKWSEDKVRKVKKQLINTGLVKDIKHIDEETHKVKGWYIQVTYILKNSTVESTLPPKPEGGSCQTVDFRGTNALSSLNINALSNNNEYIYKQVFDKWLSFESLQKHKKITDDIIKSIKKASKDYDLPTILKAIENYGEVLSKPDLYFFTYSWPLDIFLRGKGIKQFVDEAKPLTNFLKSKPSTTTNRETDEEYVKRISSVPRGRG